LALAVWSIRASRDNIRLASETRGSFGWVFFIVIGLAFLYFSYHNLFVIPALNLRDPDQDWTWLTGNPEIIDYITLHFRGFAIKVLTFGMLTLLTAATGLRAGSRRARSILFIDPILIGVHYFVWSWTAPILISAILLSGAVL
jgi:hypothetical protein